MIHFDMKRKIRENIEGKNNSPCEDHYSKNYIIIKTTYSFKLSLKSLH